MNTATRSISLLRTIDAPAGEVFAAWTDPALMQRWLAPEVSAGTAVEVEADARVGGRYLIAVVGQREVLYTAGEYRELAPPERVVMTWSSGELLARYRDNPTLVTARMRPLGPALTELAIVHSRVAAEDETGLREGWATCLDRLQALHAGNARVFRSQDPCDA
ncbi:MAG: SRPBCC domain-containing protein [Hyphomicrobiaceae bacterium]|nr:MAG: SRPBCC domain-containing protein [Hyphomicrobiaceae bacterium]